MTIPRELALWIGVGIVVVGGLLLVAVAIIQSINAKRRFRERLARVVGLPDPEAAKPRETVSQSTKAARERDRSFIDPVLGRLLGRELMPRWLTRANRLTMIIGGGVTGWIVFSIIRFLGDLPVFVAIPGGVIGGWLAFRAVFTFYQRREETRFLEGFPESMGIFVRMVRAGLPVPEAIRTVGMEGPHAVADVFKRMSDRLAIGDPMPDVMLDASKRLEIPEFRFFVVAVNIQRETGGNLAATLDNLADIIRKRRTARQRALALMSEVKASIGILTALPFIVGTFLWFQNPGYISVLFTTQRGRFVLFCAIALLTTGLTVMQLLIKRTLKGA
ncbi:MAG: type II secretion system F family protein [Alphaproteobacteria bacterium]|nr:type II secretion system F family protein [Alphaproteobacteria bacterium]